MEKPAKIDSSLTKKRGIFTRFAQKAADWTGTSFAFAGAFLIIILWGISGPVFKFSDTWQLVINTGTTIITFLMVFLIQTTQNRDTQAMQLKLDELIRTTEGAHLVLMDMEELETKELQKIREKYIAIAKKAREESRHQQGSRTDSPQISLDED